MKHSIIPLFIPHYGCPHQCIFCNQVRITGQTTPVTPSDVARIIDSYLASAKEPRFWEAAFYGGSFTALPLDVMEVLLRPASEALAAGRIGKIRLSTRPDCISEEILGVLSRMGVSIVELGVQSLSDDVLRLAERGHTAGDAEEAVRLLRERGFQVGLQFMTGLPGETMAILRASARKGAALRPDFIRLYPVLVLKDTKLAAMHLEGSYRPLTLEEAVFRCAFLKRWYQRHGIPVIRTGLQATEELDRGDSLLGGPYHPSMGELTDQYIWRHEIRRAIRGIPYGTVLQILCRREDRSKLMGYKKSTWRLLGQWIGPHVEIREDPSILPGTFRILRKGEFEA